MTETHILIATIVFGATSLYAATSVQGPQHVECEPRIEYVYVETPRVVGQPSSPAGLQWPVEGRMAYEAPPSVEEPVVTAEEPRRYHRRHYRRWRR